MTWENTSRCSAIRDQDFFLQNPGRPRELPGLEIPEVVVRVPGIEVSSFHEKLKNTSWFQLKIHPSRLEGILPETYFHGPVQVVFPPLVFSSGL